MNESRDALLLGIAEQAIKLIAEDKTIGIIEAVQLANKQPNSPFTNRDVADRVDGILIKNRIQARADFEFDLIHGEAIDIIRQIAHAPDNKLLALGNLDVYTDADISQQILSYVRVLLKVLVTANEGNRKYFTLNEVCRMSDDNFMVGIDTQLATWESLGYEVVKWTDNSKSIYDEGQNVGDYCYRTITLKRKED